MEMSDEEITCENCGVTQKRTEPAADIHARMELRMGRKVLPGEDIVHLCPDCARQFALWQALNRARNN
jgi:hypothetical protein